MFDVFTTLIIQSLSKVFGASVDIAAKDVSSKRSIATAFINLFESLYKLEKDSRVVYEHLVEAAAGDIPKPASFRESMSALFQSYESFVKNLRQIESRLAIYDEDLLVESWNMMVSKTGMMETIDMLFEAVPVQAEGGEGSAYTIIYPTALPYDDSPVAQETARQELEERAEKTRESILRKFKKKAVDLKFSSEARDAIRDAEHSLQKIRHAREQLAEFIRTNFPLRDIPR